MDPCTDCGSTSFVDSEAEAVCTSCGLVQRDVMPVTVVSYNDPMERVVLPEIFNLVFPDGGQPRRHSAQRKRTRNLRDAASGFSVEGMGAGILDRMQVPSPVVQRTFFIYKEALTTCSPCREKRMAIMVASIFVACNENRTTRTVAELVEMSGVRRKDVVRSIKNVIARVCSGREVPLGGSRAAEELIPRFVQELGVSQQDASALRVAARSALADCKNIAIQGKSPCTVAGAFLWQQARRLGLAGKGVDIEQIAKIAGVSKKTIASLLSIVVDRIGKHSE